MKFTASCIHGSGRGATLGVPTVNVSLGDVPKKLAYGVYACIASINQESDLYEAVLHFGPRPVYQDAPSCEIHFLHQVLTKNPSTLTVTVKGMLRSVQNFSSSEKLLAQIKKDIAAAHAMLENGDAIS